MIAQDNAFKSKINKIEAGLNGQPLLTEEWFDGSAAIPDQAIAFNELNKHSAVYKDYPFLMQQWHDCPADRADVAFIFNELSKVPDPIKRIILKNAFKINVRRDRNIYIRNTTKRIVDLLTPKLRYALTVDEDEIRAISENCADRCRRIAIHHNVKGRVNALTDICHSNSGDIYRLLTEYCASFSIKAIKLSEQGVTHSGITESSAIKRMMDKNWWNRRLRKIFNQAYEQAAIELNLVQKYKQIYASDLTVKKRKQQKEIKFL